MAKKRNAKRWTPKERQSLITDMTNLLNSGVKASKAYSRIGNALGRSKLSIANEWGRIQRRAKKIPKAPVSQGKVQSITVPLKEFAFGAKTSMGVLIIDPDKITIIANKEGLNIQYLDNGITISKA